MKNIPKASKDIYYMHGKHAVFAALNNPKRIIKNILCTNETFEQYKDIINKFSYEIVTNNGLTQLLGYNHPHQGIAARVKSIFLNDVQDIDLSQNNCKIVILDQVTDPQNIGAIIRSAASFNITAMILPNDNAPDENSTIAKAASGALELVQVIKVTNLKSTMDYLKKHGFWIIGLDSHTTTQLNSEILSDKVAIVVGSEDKGIRRLVKENCDHLVKIPISNKVESLNVSNAAAIVFYLASNG
jgi:23S rRNA (guanosine2251-2'-O)-methyltransferase